MIVELFGPPGVGKTSLTNRLVARLRADSYPVDSWSSRRPAEPDGGATDGRMPHQARSRFLQRIVKPTLELYHSQHAAPPRVQSQSVAIQLFQEFPVHGAFQRFKRWQYMERLQQKWERAQRHDGITVFDQGYIQLVCSLAMHTRCLGPETLARALDRVPRADVTIRVTAPSELISQRLVDRLRLQKRLERLLESEMSSSISSFDTFRLIDDVLHSLGRNVISVSSIDANTIAVDSETAASEIIRVFLFSRLGVRPELA